ncbi:MAG: hypothetical protein FWG53_08495 [Clostridiales bacterium]|nr:hypothetical protein [Clostridiales bacterium]
MAQEALSSISTNPDERARYHSRKMWEMDRAHEDEPTVKQLKMELDNAGQ